MRKALLLCCLGLCLCATAQEKEALRRQVAAEPAYGKRLDLYLTFLERSVTRDFDDVLELGTEALGLSRRHKDSTGVARIERYIGEAYYFKGDYPSAARYFYGSIQKLEQLPPAAALGHSYNALAKLYRKTRDLPRALQHYDKALALFRNLADSAGVSMILNESGVVFEYAGNYPAAITRYEASLAIDRQRDDTLGITYALGNLAGVYLLQSKYTKALDYQQQVLNLRKRLRDTFSLAISFADIGELYLAMHLPVRARSYADTSIRMATAMGYRELLRNNYDLLARAAEAEGDAAGALALYRRRAQLQDSLFSVARAEQIEELNARYEALKKEQTIRDQAYQLGRQRLLLVASAGLLLLGGALGWNFHRRRRLAQEARMQAAILQQQELATRAILSAEESERQRIANDLHDGVGQLMSAARMNLSALGHRLVMDHPGTRADFEQIVGLVDDSCREVRSVAHHMMPNALLKNSLAAAVREFVDKIDHRALQVHLYTSGLETRLDPQVETVLYRVIQECVNNVIKHSGADTLDIAIARDHDELTATIEDNGRGFPAAAAAEGMGLRNIRTRVEYLKGDVEFDSSPGRGTVVLIRVPLAATTLTATDT
ncbi:tetratricopeptide repeat-containing sensor histidine kinase [Flaviaesturariibacter aridisoli]|uniref:Oxygen sensor histidine kinase NreB n=1 Tax=Flaviaesturariibacter aridisoli TaxID=2545761 RepID=A0A4R4E310_9BACT|nr:sensor histidine kinase [Flaviaesturariibacter aridisoli]TCZ71421.1 tetratricopeptide repeat protein [Flaviaesturariibacter aridisoli]